MNQEEVTRQQFDLTAKAYSKAPLFGRGYDLKLIVSWVGELTDMFLSLARISDDFYELII